MQLHKQTGSSDNQYLALETAGRVMYMQDRWDDAIKTFHDALILHPSVFHQSRLYLLIANVYHRMSSSVSSSEEKMKLLEIAKSQIDLSEKLTINTELRTDSYVAMRTNVESAQCLLTSKRKDCEVEKEDLIKEELIKKLESAIENTQKMDQIDIEAVYWNSIAAILFNDGNYIAAVEKLLIAERLWVKYRNKSNRDHFLVASGNERRIVDCQDLLILGYIKLGEFEKAFEVAERSRGFGLIMESQNRAAHRKVTLDDKSFLSFEKVQKFVQEHNVNIVFYGIANEAIIGTADI